MSLWYHNCYSSVVIRCRATKQSKNRKTEKKKETAAVAEAWLLASACWVSMYDKAHFPSLLYTVTSQWELRESYYLATVIHGKHGSALQNIDFRRWMLWIIFSAWAMGWHWCFCMKNWVQGPDPINSWTERQDTCGRILIHEEHMEGLPSANRLPTIEVWRENMHASSVSAVYQMDRIIVILSSPMSLDRMYYFLSSLMQ